MISTDKCLSIIINKNVQNKQCYLQSPLGLFKKNLGPDYGHYWFYIILTCIKGALKQLILDLSSCMY